MANTKRDTILEGQKTTLLASVDLSSSINLLVVQTSGEAAICGAGAQAIGVLTQVNVAGEAVGIGFNGEFDAISGAAVAEGAELESDAAGKVITLAAGIKIGYALKAATGANETIKCRIL